MQPHLVPDCRTVREFDDYITVPCFGWPNTDAYYAGSSSSLSVPHVRRGDAGTGGMAWGWGWGLGVTGIVIPCLRLAQYKCLSKGYCAGFS